MLPTNEHLGPIPDKRRRKVKPPTQSVSIKPLDVCPPPPMKHHRKKRVGFKVGLYILNTHMYIRATCSQYDISFSDRVRGAAVEIAFIAAKNKMVEAMREAGLHVDNMEFINEKP